MTTPLAADDLGPGSERNHGGRSRPVQRHRVGPKGQVVIPKEHREALGLEPGDQVMFSLAEGGDRVEVRRAASDRPLRGRFAGSPLTTDLVDERQRDRARENDR